ncbi:hypothetical protein [Microbulbifer thermotolerans]|uniref:Lipoprotein SmpA/OmlA domain-containing protein n=1 Tax=Microbulbifer thermotolerans TaxID=252514 RepID=A0A143HLM7_MICTH|nr:hypothetical protein [Microbulbifer thermotolerans]AMX02625.1 hypothetical protein A3224_08550 [Microbulbifer thermotolerans]MCX2779775.1 hypothetical protein [Microbulbifer thermotolerans]MCX2782293.1 hypothetical protein [Microbulbifer thermotolerans]MCX2794443.1 hypothetical protein [Microbulbifer thermotolerans]MCX2800446.1 hypothetical protein [Microbulbifer thermotolerans]
MVIRLRSRIPLLISAAVLSLSFGARAESLQVPVGAQGSEVHVEQLRGLKKDQVNARLGEPLSIEGPVGDPAITRWEYPDFYVYFEWDVALHTVKKHRG